MNATMRFFPLGSIELDNPDNLHPISSLEIVETELGPRKWCVAACDESGTVTLIFVDVTLNNKVLVKALNMTTDVTTTFSQHTCMID